MEKGQSCQQVMVRKNRAGPFLFTNYVRKLTPNEPKTLMQSLKLGSSERKAQGKLYHAGLGDGLLTVTPNAQATKGKIDKLGHIKRKRKKYNLIKKEQRT